MKNKLNLCLTLFLFSALLNSCGNNKQNEENKNEENKISENDLKGIALVNSVIQITGQDFSKGSSTSGMVAGDAIMQIISSEAEVQVLVKYRYLLSSGIKEAQEQGHLENFIIRRNGPNNTLTIQADWINKESGDGLFTLRSYKEEEPGTIVAQIDAKGGGNWRHTAWVGLSEIGYWNYFSVMGADEDVEKLLEENKSRDLNESIELEQYLDKNQITAEPTESGLIIIIETEGSGPVPQRGQTIQVHYTSMLMDGTILESSEPSGQPFSFSVGMGQVIEELEEAFSILRVGTKARIIVPRHLHNIKINPYPNVIYDIEIISAD